jgi:hypothetical protein
METNTCRSKGYMVRISNEDREYPSNMGQKWSDDEEILLLEELNNNIDIEIIAQNHNRTIGGIINKKDYIELTNDIKQIKNTLGELVEMMKAVYEFEDI